MDFTEKQNKIVVPQGFNSQPKANDSSRDVAIS